MSKMIDNIKKTRKCTFCKYWSDLSSSNIKPKTSDGKIWEYESSTFNVCTKCRCKTRASSTCGKFENKMNM